MNPELWPRLSALLDEALDRPAEARAAWLEHMALTLPDMARSIRSILAAMVQAEDARFLESMPTLDQLAPPEQVTGAGGVLGPYVLEAELGRGGMAVVWRARRVDGTLNRVVALKLPHSQQFDSDLPARFARERDILASLEHPHIARIYDAGSTAAGQSFLALELVTGVPIDRYCHARSLPIRERLQLFLQVLDAVQYAHSRLVIHRDIKPSNILVRPDGTSKLLDFGIAKLVAPQSESGDETRVDLRRLTPRYASPEQCTGAPVTTSTDIYSLGVLLYELLCGNPPNKDFARQSAVQDRGSWPDALMPSAAPLTDAIAAARQLTVGRLRRMLRGDLDTIALKALAYEPARRFTTVDAFAQDLRRYLRGDAVLSRRDSLWYRLGKFSRQHRFAVAASMAGLLAFGAGGSVAIWQSRVAEQKARLAEDQARTAESVLQFIEGIFRANSTAQPDPVKARNTTARELLDIGTRRIRDSLGETPTAKLRVLKTLSKMYEELDIYTDTALELATERVTLARGRDGPDRSTVLAEALLYLSETAFLAGRLDLFGKSLDEAGVLLNGSTTVPVQLRARLELGEGKRAYNDNLRQAQLHFDAALAEFRRLPASMELLDALSWSAVAARAVGDYPAALRAAQAGLTALTALGPDANGERPFVLQELARSQRAMEQFAEAEGTFGTALNAALQVEGPRGGTLYLGVSNELADLLIDTSRPLQALAGLGDAHAVAMQLAGAGDQSTSPTWLLYREAKALVRSGRPEAAIALLDRIDDMRKGLETRPGLRAALLERRGEALIQLGRYALAEPSLHEATRLRREAGEQGTAVYNLGIGARVHLLMAIGRFEEAAGVLGEYTVPAKEGLQTRLPLIERQTLGAELAWAQGDAGAARASAHAVTTLLPAAAERRYFASWEARAQYIEGIARMQGARCDDALPSLRRSVELSSEIFDSKHALALARAEFVLGKCLAASGDRMAADALQAKARAIAATHATSPAWLLTRPSLPLTD